ncbi:hypothetical protein ACF0H5_009815 [Mactra antiquata]
MLSQLNSKLSPLYTGAIDNRTHWQELDDLYREGKTEELRKILGTSNDTCNDKCEEKNNNKEEPSIKQQKNASNEDLKRSNHKVDKTSVCVIL